MQENTENALKTAGITGVGALLGGLLGSKSQLLKNKIGKAAIDFGMKPTAHSLNVGAGGAGAILGGAASGLASDPSFSTESGLIAGGLLSGIAGAGPFLKSNPKTALLKYIMGTGLGATVGAGAGSYFGHRNGTAKDINTMTPEERLKIFGQEEVYPHG